MAKKVGGARKLVLADSDLASPYVLFANHTQSQKNDADTVETELRAFTIPGGTLGKNDTLKITHLWTFPNSATTKAVKMYIGGVLFASYGITTNDKHQGVEYFRNRGSQISNFAVNDQIPFGPRTGGILATAVDMTVDQVLSVRGRWGTVGTGTNILTLESVLVEVIPGA